MTDQPAEQKPTKRKAPREARPVHMLVNVDNSTGDLIDFEVFTAELTARRALDDRGNEWRYTLVAPGVPFSQSRAAQQGHLP